MNPKVFFAAIFSLAALPLGATDVTVYNDDLALVRETRMLRLPDGLGSVEVADVAARIDATSVHFKSLTDPDGVSVLEQNFQYDLVSQDKLLEKYIGKEIELERFAGMGGEKRETIKGTLLAEQGGRVLQVGKKIYLNPAGSPVLSELPEGFLTKPTLLWTLSSRKGGAHQCEISYLTSGMSWSSDYVMVSSPKDDRADLNAWVTLNNNSGAVYKDAKLKLVAGSVNRAPANVPQMQRFKEARAFAAMDMGGQQFQEKTFFEYHLYTLQRPTTLMNNETKQIEMASASNIPLKKLFIYDGIRDQKKVAVMLEFKNSKDNSLGSPLPKGRVRVYKKDTDGALEFVGEDSIDHTPKDETVRVKMGDAFDVVGERSRTNQTNDKRSSAESYEIKLRNHKEEDVTVTVVEHLNQWREWKVTESSRKFRKKDAQTIEFDVPVKKDQEETVAYTVKYSW